MATYDSDQALAQRQGIDQAQLESSRDTASYSKGAYDVDGIEEQHSIQRGNTRDAPAGAHSPANRRTGWFFPALLILSSIAIFTLSGTLLSVTRDAESDGETGEPSEETSGVSTGKPTSVLQRANSEYVLKPTWDFTAPPQVREYDFVIADGIGSPDGVYKPMMIINNQFPGPLIEINENDVLVVNVKNEAANATSLHWHGIFQNGTNWMDGAAGLTQCPIAPGQSFQYKFNVTQQAGTYFYHGHQGVQALDGMVGPMVVHSIREASRPRLPYSSDRVILLQDWYYDQASGLMREVLSPGSEDAPIPNTALMNGVNQAICSDHPGRDCTDVQAADLPQIQVMSSERHRLRFINAGGFAWFQVAVDDHDDLQVIEVDGNVVDPTLSSPLVIAPGQRYSAVLRAEHENGMFWLRARMLTACFASQRLPENGIDEAKAIISYTNGLHSRHGDEGDHDTDESTDDDDEEEEKHDAEEIVLPDTTSSIPFLPTCKDSAIASFRPSPARKAPESADHSWYLRVNLAIGDWRLQRGVLNTSSFRADLKHPTLHRVIDGLAEKNESFTVEGINDAAFDLESEFTISSNKVEVVDIILQNMDEKSHPFHLHGTRMWVLGAGHGYWPGYEALGLQPEGKGLLDAANASVVDNPLYRDTITAEGFGWVLLRLVADNPGAWLFHCHVIWHSEAGMAMQFLSRLDVMRTWTLPDDVRELCDAPEEELTKGAPPKDEIFFGFHDDEDEDSE
ncbi:multicopper oxidase-domain-containing protein [Xylariaceae sp. FL1272]|nr:multicopper oxidase-domain-containing protein [Xylariaceae sp. FL1272]